MNRLITLMLLIIALIGIASGQTKFDMPTQLKQWSGTNPNDGQIPIFNATTGTYTPGDPLVTANIPTIVQKTSNSSTGSVASLAKVFASNNTAKNSIIVVCGVGNGTAPTISDTNSNVYTSAIQVANGTAFNVAIFYATNIAAGANTITVNNGGTTASIAMEIYEVSGLIALSPQVLDKTSSGTGTSTSLSSGLITPISNNEFTFVAFGVGTAAQTITVTGGFNNDSGQLNPTTPAGLFSFVSASQFISDFGTLTGTATITSEPWASVIASFQPVLFPMQGTVRTDQTSHGTTDLVAADITKANGTTLDTNSGNKSAGTVRVVLATDQPALTNAQPQNITQINSTAIVADPCQTSTKIFVSITQTANTKVITGTSAKKISICSIHIVSATAQNVAVVEGTGTTCATNTVGVSGFGGSTAGTGWNFAANGGISYGNGASALGQESVAADDLCVFQSGSGQVSGGISYTVN